MAALMVPLALTAQDRLKTMPGYDAAQRMARVYLSITTLDSELALGRSWYLMLSGTHETGGWSAVNQGYGTISWRF